jgi:hypothetical protein
VVLHNRDLPGSPAFSGQRDSHHAITSDGTPYVYSLVFGENLSVADNNHPTSRSPHDRVYAHNLSHEIAEMVVDPSLNIGNPEVFDPCSANCNLFLFDLFDQNGVFLRGTTDTGTESGFTFFIEPVVWPNAAYNSTGCLAEDPQNACIYLPPFVTGELLSYGDAGTPGNVSNPMVVGFGGWLPFKSLFAGRNAAGQDRIYAVNQNGELLSYFDTGTQ